MKLQLLLLALIVAAVCAQEATPAPRADIVQRTRAALQNIVELVKRRLDRKLAVGEYNWIY